MVYLYLYFNNTSETGKKRFILEVKGNKMTFDPLTVFHSILSAWNKAIGSLKFSRYFVPSWFELHASSLLKRLKRKTRENHEKGFTTPRKQPNDLGFALTWPHLNGPRLNTYFSSRRFE